jgi:hypothetical protein
LLINVFSKYPGSNFIGRRRTRGEKFVEQAISKLFPKAPKSKKRKLNQNEDDNTEIENKMNDEKDEGSCKLIGSSEIRSSMVDDVVNQGTVKNLHLLCDLRGFTNSEEKSAINYAASLYCSGGDSAYQKFSKIYAKNERDLSSCRSHSSINAKTSNSTTAMDFERFSVNYCVIIFE